MFRSEGLLLFSMLAFSSIDADTFVWGNTKCENHPEPVAFSTLRCDQNACTMECIQDYKFPRGEKSVELNCYNGRDWGAARYGNFMPDCETHCDGGCKNGGKCLLRNKCMCPKDFMGKNCEMRIQTCIDKAPMPSNAMGKCVLVDGKPQSCKATCIEGHQFPDGSLTIDILCRDGQWIKTPRNFNRCEPQCNPSCMNGGHCIAHNYCQCPPEFRGDQCQYPIDRCSPEKMKFNGMYRCQASLDKIDCKLTCPAGFASTSPLASSYTCRYEEGVYRPHQNPPNCDYGDAQVEITHG